MSDSEGRKFSRRGLILALANEDRGAHVSPEGGLDGAHAGPVYNKGPWHSLESPVPASMRQIGYEALVSLAQSYPETFGDDQLLAHYRKLTSTRDLYQVEDTLVASVEVMVQPAPERRPSSARPRRNKPCPCGSGLKFKKCCGLQAELNADPS
jgi:hypothetical protein